MATVDRFFKEGQSAFYKPKKYGRFIHHACNPYTSSSFRGKEWQRGFNNSYGKILKKRHKFPGTKTHGHVVSPL
jgi:hypothetical protein|tara:strand:+ start:146 stop:367 length:222 start_codon:yes stop_codon:yes gene_type:complete